MNFISFSEYLQVWRVHGLTEQEAAERLLQALRAPGNALHVRALRTELDAGEPSAEDERQRWRAHQRMDRIGRWLEDERERREIGECPKTQDPAAARRPMSARRWEALKQAWRRLQAMAAGPEPRPLAVTSASPEPVPAYLWSLVDRVDTSLRSRWSDDDEHQQDGILVDWRAGKITEWDLFGSVEYCNLQVHNHLVQPTLIEVSNRIRNSPISDQNKFWNDNEEYLKFAGLTRKESFRDLWAGNKNPNRSRGPKPKQIDHRDAGAES